MRQGLVLLENLSIYSEEKKNDPNFAEALASLGDIYVNESRSANKEQYASIVSLPKLLPAYAGNVLYSEWEFLSSLREKKSSAFYLILGGINLEKKLSFLQRCMANLRGLIIGGGIAYSFLHSRAIPVGRSLREEGMEVNAFQVIEKAELERIELVLPKDHLTAKQINANAATQSTSRITEDWIGVDMGSKSLSLCQKALSKASAILWYGPLGVSEIKKFSKASYKLASFWLSPRREYALLEMIQPR